MTTVPPAEAVAPALVLLATCTATRCLLRKKRTTCGKRGIVPSAFSPDAFQAIAFGGLCPVTLKLLTSENYAVSSAGPRSGQKVSATRTVVVDLKRNGLNELFAGLEVQLPRRDDRRLRERRGS